jgi:hypothetical protein
MPWEIVAMIWLVMLGIGAVSFIVPWMVLEAVERFGGGAR